MRSLILLILGCGAVAVALWFLSTVLRGAVLSYEGFG